MQEQSIFCTIGVAAHNEERTLPQMLKSLKEQALPQGWLFHTIVVANGCTDSTVQAALAFGFSGWGVPRFFRDRTTCWWHFAGDSHSFSVCEVPTARKSLALNIIHQTLDSEIVLLFDADIQLDQDVIKLMCQALVDHPGFGAVATGYQGYIPPMETSQGFLRELYRVYISNAINHFDQCRVRLDGKAFGYRRSLITEHPSLIAVDTWLEGMAWQYSSGCIYLTDTYVRYSFPRKLEELIAQYTRYAKTYKEFSRKYPDMLNCVRRGRDQSHDSSRRLSPAFRLIGWTFLTWTRLWARATPCCEEGERWEAIQSTKHNRYA